ncbi:hypothetical protein EV207_11587 [Scopulibacillus darangshiensis]|uniref:Uncharacterized protein n=1 Tax=Scopulibacillus darangshiensis TaxID=442528 RepID=A0A4R2P4I4_9BACL|nr:hypothetical protein [Scopulibacillus darangshiensis]TCP28851.1 hypothetical protein EV207_11587 [Scopulibacillus darangshiensis]
MPFRISFKGVAAFLAIVVSANIILLYPLAAMGLSPASSTFVCSSIFGTIGILVVIGKIDGKITSRKQWMTWTALSAVICTLLSYYLTYSTF